MLLLRRKLGTRKIADWVKLVAQLHLLTFLPNHFFYCFLLLVIYFLSLHVADIISEQGLLHNLFPQSLFVLPMQLCQNSVNLTFHLILLFLKLPKLVHCRRFLFMMIPLGFYVWGAEVKFALFNPQLILFGRSFIDLSGLWVCLKARSYGVEVLRGNLRRIWKATAAIVPEVSPIYLGFGAWVPWH